MQRMKWLFIPLVVIIFTAQKCSTPQAKEPRVIIETQFGEMEIKLYNETPIHRDNFLKLAQEGFYDSLLFHRVIRNFMIQGGDPESKNSKAGARLGSGGPGYTIEAEILPQFYHKKGALAAARQGDQVNPEKRSSGSQFYIVQGKTYSAKDLDQFVAGKTRNARNAAAQAFLQQPENAEQLANIQRFQLEGKQDSINAYLESITPILDSLAGLPEGGFTYSEQAILDYQNIGGTPHLDGGYTVFGEVTKGLNIVDSITALPVDGASRPQTNVVFSVRIEK